MTSVMQSFPIGRIRGIDLHVHPTFGLVLLWIVYHFGVAGGGSLGSLTYGVVLMTLVFCCVVLHELGHSMMAQEFGIRVRNITLFPFGGAAFIEQMPMQPKGELLVTIAGPAVNVSIAVALLPLLLLYGIVGGFHSFAELLNEFDSISFPGILIYLFFANITIALFNLLPAFPMDGGRLVRAGLTRILGRDRATSIAVVLGFSIATAMAIFGLW